MQCLVCGKRIKWGLYHDDESPFCNTVCAVFFARAVCHAVFLPGEDFRKIDNWLSQFTMVQKKRAQAAGSKL